MSLGRKKSGSGGEVKINAPPAITQYDFTSPTGDQYKSWRKGNTEFGQSFLTPETSRTIQSSKSAMSHLADELNSPDASRLGQIYQASRNFYDLQARNIDSEADAILGQAKSDLSKRFGGAFNATFGTDYLARLENNRLGRLYDAAKEATLFGEDLYSRDEDSRMRRFQLFSNYLNDEYNKATGAATTGSNILQSEANRAQNLAIQRANMANSALNREAQARASRASTLNTIIGVGGDLAMTAAKLAF